MKEKAGLSAGGSIRREAYRRRNTVFEWESFSQPPITSGDIFH